MFWQEDDKPKAFEVPDDIVDLVFDIQCRELPVDHAHDLAAAIRAHLPDIEDDDRLGVHSIHLAGSQNGWERPDPKLGQNLILSRRTKLTLRVPKERAEAIKARLEGARLDVGGCELRLGKAKERLLSKQGVLFSRFVQCDPAEDEDAFLQRIADELARRGIRIRKALCGKSTPIHTPDGPLHTRSLMIADLKPEDAVKLQQRGVGKGREMGLGIFLPHKGIEAVKESSED